MNTVSVTLYSDLLNPDTAGSPATMDVDRSCFSDLVEIDVNSVPDWVLADVVYWLGHLYYAKRQVYEDAIWFSSDLNIDAILDGVQCDAGSGGTAPPSFMLGTITPLYALTDSGSKTIVLNPSITTIQPWGLVIPDGLNILQIIIEGVLKADIKITQSVKVRIGFGDDMGITGMYDEFTVAHPTTLFNNPFRLVFNPISDPDGFVSSGYIVGNPALIPSLNTVSGTGLSIVTADDIFDKELLIHIITVDAAVTGYTIALRDLKISCVTGSIID